jgi:hypothetical protein
LRLVPDPEPGRVVPLRDPDPDPDAEPAHEDDPEPPLVAGAPGAPHAEATAAEDAAEATTVPTLDGEQAVAILTATLDDLGAAHRRPFTHV